jgi:hypothetical protein
MKTYGDIPKKDQALIKELEGLELWFDNHRETVNPEDAAKGFTCLAHDYYGLYMEEEGDRLIRRAEYICPDYFKGRIYEQARRHRDFNGVVESLSLSHGMDLMKKFGFNCAKLFN